MRHSLAFAVATLPIGVIAPALRAGLMTGARLLQRATPSSQTAGRGAVALASIAPRADREGGPTGRPGANDETVRFHALSCVESWTRRSSRATCRRSSKGDDLRSEGPVGRETKADPRCFFLRKRAHRTPKRPRRIPRLERSDQTIRSKKTRSLAIINTCEHGASSHWRRRCPSSRPTRLSRSSSRT